MYDVEAQVTQAVNFVVNIPPHTNPYSATARFLVASLQPPAFPTWATIVMRCMLAGFLIMFFQSCFLLYILVKNKEFYIFRWNALGLIQFQASTVGAIGALSYSAVSVADFSLRESIAAGHHDQSWEILLWGGKGLFLLELFLWITACQCASIKWKIGAKTSDVHKVRMPPALPWIMHIWLLIVLVIPPIPILWAFTRANTEYIIISEIMQPIVKRLLRLARTYTRASDAYHRSKVLPLLAATAPTIPHIAAIYRSIKLALDFYFVVMASITLACIPLFILTLRHMYIRPPKGQSLHDQESKRSQSNKDQRRVLAQNCLLLFLTSLLHVPVLAWEILYPGDPTHSQTWWVGSSIGVHLPVTIGANIRLAVLIRNVLRRARQASSRSISATEKSTSDTGVPNTLDAQVQHVRVGSRNRFEGTLHDDFLEDGDKEEDIHPPLITHIDIFKGPLKIGPSSTHSSYLSDEALLSSQIGNENLIPGIVLTEILADSPHLPSSPYTGVVLESDKH